MFCIQLLIHTKSTISRYKVVFIWFLLCSLISTHQARLHRGIHPVPTMMKMEESETNKSDAQEKWNKCLIHCWSTQILTFRDGVSETKSDAQEIDICAILPGSLTPPPSVR